MKCILKKKVEGNFQEMVAEARITFFKDPGHDP